MVETPTLVIIVPCFQEEEALPGTHERLSGLLAGMVSRGEVSARSRIAYIDDGSTDATWHLAKGYADATEMACAVKLSSNVGLQNAIIAGLETMLDEADIFITIDADLQDDIQAIPTMVQRYKEGYEIVYGVRTNRRSDSWFKRTSAMAFYRLMHHLGTRSVYNHADFRLMDRRTVAELLRYPERNLFMRGIVPLMGFKSTTVEYERAERTAGKSKYPLSKMMGLAVDGITSFSIRPVRLVLVMGVVFVFVAIIILAYVLYSKFSGHAVTGWSSTILSLWFIGGCILIGLGVVGEYIGKIYMEVKARPRYHVDQKIIK
ncbi:MAG: glycosyltransferase family 2 protein [Bacteroidales bacterium]|nr:glycosyltransferase family 2 protein [Bacteroidales bacterium]